ncbi:MAG: hypothetical protein SNJ75_12650 [Gemmataceae bacterium]
MNAFPPDRADDDDDLHQLAEVYRRHAPPDPSPAQWQRVQQAITRGLDCSPSESCVPSAKSNLRRTVWLRVALLLFALGSILGWTLIGTAPRPYASLPPDEANPEPFAVASAAEIFIHDIAIADADRIALGRLLLGKLEFADAGEIEVVETRPDPTEGWTPTMSAQSAMPLIVASGQEP